MKKSKKLDLNRDLGFAERGKEREILRCRGGDKVDGDEVGRDKV